MIVEIRKGRWLLIFIEPFSDHVRIGEYKIVKLLLWKLSVDEKVTYLDEDGNGAHGLLLTDFSHYVGSAGSCGEICVASWWNDWSGEGFLFFFDVDDNNGFLHHNVSFIVQIPTWSDVQSLISFSSRSRCLQGMIWEMLERYDKLPSFRQSGLCSLVRAMGGRWETLGMELRDRND